jgi:hypothetical protein
VAVVDDAPYSQLTPLSGVAVQARQSTIYIGWNRVRPCQSELGAVCALLRIWLLTEKKAREILTGNYRRCNIVAHCLMAQGALLRQYISAGSLIPSLVLTQQLFTSPAHSAHFSFFVSHTGYGGSVVDCGAGYAAFW